MNLTVTARNTHGCLVSIAYITVLTLTVCLQRQFKWSARKETISFVSHFSSNEMSSAMLEVTWDIVAQPLAPPLPPTCPFDWNMFLSAFHTVMPDSVSLHISTSFSLTGVQKSAIVNSMHVTGSHSLIGYMRDSYSWAVVAMFTSADRH